MTSAPAQTASATPAPRRVRCRSAPSVFTALLIVAATACLTCSLLLPAAVQASPPHEGNLGQLDRSVAYLQAVQNRDGGFGGRPGGGSDPIFSAWVGVGLAATGINPRDQVRRRGESSLYAYLTRHAGALEETTDFERAMLVAISAGTSPYRFGGRNLVATVLARQLPDGSFPHEAGGSRGGINDTAFAILPLSALPSPQTRAAVMRAVGWLLSVQEADGSWGFAPGVGPSSDMTAAVIQALRAARVGGSSDAEARGWAYIRRTQTSEGGFSERPGEAEANTASTAWVVQAMWAAGIAPESWRVTDGGSDPLSYLASMQQADGSVRWKRSRDLNPIWMTAYVAPALAGHPLPVPAVPRTRESGRSGGPAGAGGGGRGAPLFSRPQPQSGGRATGGVRRVRGEDEARRTRRGGEQPRGRPQPLPPPSSVQSSGDGTEAAPTQATAGGKTPTAGSTAATPTKPAPPSASNGPTEESHGNTPGSGKRRRSERTGNGTVTGYLIDPTLLAPGRDGDGDRHAAAPGIAGRLRGPAPTATIALVGALLISLALGAVTELRRRPLSLPPQSYK